jgi:3-keto-disaccharide hydrolase
MKNNLRIFCLLLIFLVCLSCNNNDGKKEISKEDWESLFNGKDLTGWDIKIKDHSLNENYKNTFRIEDNMIRVVYSDYEKFDNQFGHLYTHKPYSYYKLRLQYRFVGDHLADAPEWADRNSGVMLHSQSAQSVNINQNFPVSLEFQFLCGNGNDTVPTGNVCTPGTFITYNGKTFLGHIQNSNSKTYLKNEWINAEAEVFGDSLIRHIINGDTVLTYTNAMIGEGFVSNTNSWTWAGVTDSLFWINKANTPLKEGHIALQAESQPIDFRRIEILDLVGCTDPKAKNYKAYCIKSDNSRCKY